MNSFFTHFKQAKKSSHVMHELNPHRQWIILVRASIFVGFGLVAMSIYFLFQIRNDQVFQFSRSRTVKTQAVNEKALKKTTDLFEEKARIHEDLIKNAPVYRDPSI